MRRGIVLLVGAVVLLAVAAPAYAADKDCRDFTSHDQAQAYFKANGGSASNNFDRLDADGDGVACEDLPASGQPSDQPSGQDEPTNQGEALPFTGPGDTSSVLAATLLGAGVLLLLVTRRRPGHDR